MTGTTKAELSERSGHRQGKQIYKWQTGPRRRCSSLKQRCVQGDWVQQEAKGWLGCGRHISTHKRESGWETAAWVSDTLADFKGRVERGCWAQHVDTQGLSQVVLHREEESPRMTGKNEKWHLAKIWGLASQVEATLWTNQKGQVGLMGCFQQECMLWEDKVLIFGQKPEKRNQSPAEKVP